MSGKRYQRSRLWWLWPHLLVRLRHVRGVVGIVAVGLDGQPQVGDAGGQALEVGGPQADGEGGEAQRCAEGKHLAVLAHRHVAHAICEGNGRGCSYANCGRAQQGMRVTEDRGVFTKPRLLA